MPARKKRSSVFQIQIPELSERITVKAVFLLHENLKGPVALQDLADQHVGRFGQDAPDHGEQGKGVIGQAGKGMKLMQESVYFFLSAFAAFEIVLFDGALFHAQGQKDEHGCHAGPVLAVGAVEEKRNLSFQKEIEQELIGSVGKSQGSAVAGDQDVGGIAFLVFVEDQRGQRSGEIEIVQEILEGGAFVVIGRSLQRGIGPPRCSAFRAEIQDGLKAQLLYRYQFFFAEKGRAELRKISPFRTCLPSRAGSPPRSRMLSLAGS